MDPITARNNTLRIYEDLNGQLEVMEYELVDDYNIIATNIYSYITNNPSSTQQQDYIIDKLVESDERFEEYINNQVIDEGDLFGEIFFLLGLKYNGIKFNI